MLPFRGNYTSFFEVVLLYFFMYSAFKFAQLMCIQSE